MSTTQKKPNVSIWIYKPNWVFFDVHDEYEEDFLDWFQDNFSMDQFGQIRQAWCSYKDDTMFVRYFGQVIDNELLTELILMADRIVDHGADTKN